MNLRNAVGIVLLAGGAAASYWYSRPPPAEPASQTSVGGELPGYYMKNVRLTATDEQGRVALQIEAESLAELPEERFTLEGVRIEYTPADETPWSISARSAITPKDRSHVDLEGDVRFRSAPTDGSDPMQILAPTMHFQPRDSRATSGGAVEIRVGDWRWTGVGLNTLLNAKKLTLESKVHAEFSR
ncbi:MAG TPA: LPS export ABC transporter periplasmic protein LptC [Gammaproteobacteria bacterium]|nr:LPS export ABC transporter periplasmic protein LptC [Gammaproteobacteria bacterium]